MPIRGPSPIVNAQPMSVDGRWHPAPRSPFPVTQSRTTVTARSTHPLYALIEEHSPRFLERLEAEGVSLPPLRQGRARGLPEMRAHRTRLPARQVRGLPPREARGVQLHTPRPLPELWRPTHGRDRRTSRRPRPARATGPPVESVVPLPASSPLCHATRGPHPNPWHHLPGDLHLPHPPRRIARGRRRSHRSRHPRPTLPPQTPRSGTTQRARAASGTVGPRRTRRLGLAHRFPTPLTECGPSPPRASLTEPRPPSSAHPHFPHSSTPHGDSEIPAPDPSNRLEPNTAILLPTTRFDGVFPLFAR